MTGMILIKRFCFFFYLARRFSMSANGMKQYYVKDLLNGKTDRLGQLVQMLGFLKDRRKKGNVLFLDIEDSSGHIQCVIENTPENAAFFAEAKRVPLESAIFVQGLLQGRGNRPNEIHLTSLQTLGEATLQLDPRPRSDFDIFDERLTDHLLSHRHLYLRNPKVQAILKLRSLFMKIAREWFDKKSFTEFDAPIITPAPLYTADTALGIKVHGNSAFLSQCAGFYLEAAAQAFDKVFNMGPSFRGAESKSKRHLTEYYHIKAEMLSGNLGSIMGTIEEFLPYVIKRLKKEGKSQMEILGLTFCDDALKTPYARVSYEEAITYLQSQGHPAKFGEAISSKEETALSERFGKGRPLWIVGNPRMVEPFPYVINEDDSRLTNVADLIATRGCGELLGVAEKIFCPKMLDTRLGEKGKLDDPNYQFVREVHAAGCAPHTAFGMGVERCLRWMMNIDHVRDTIPFPRVVGRSELIECSRSRGRVRRSTGSKSGSGPGPMPAPV
jgi:asparaginyl-tRNA synthetase